GRVSVEVGPDRSPPGAGPLSGPGPPLRLAPGGRRPEELRGAQHPNPFADPGAPRSPRQLPVVRRSGRAHRGHRRQARDPGHPRAAEVGRAALRLRALLGPGPHRRGHPPRRGVTRPALRDRLASRADAVRAPGGVRGDRAWLPPAPLERGDPPRRHPDDDREAGARMSRGGWVVLALLAAAPAQAQGTPAAGEEADLAAVQSEFEFGHYREVLERSERRIDRGGIDEASLVQWHKLPRLAAFNLNRTQPAPRRLAPPPRLAPDSALAPFVYPPPAVAFVEKQRQALAPELDRIRAERRAQASAAKRAAEERAALAREAEEQRRQIEEMSRQVTVRTVEKRSFLVNFVPFGAGQFQQGRVAAGAGFAIAEALLGITSIVAYFAYGS